MPVNQRLPFPQPRGKKALRIKVWRKVQENFETSAEVALLVILRE
jgi:hypothetical protein